MQAVCKSSLIIILTGVLIYQKIAQASDEYTEAVYYQISLSSTTDSPCINIKSLLKGNNAGKSLLKIPPNVTQFQYHSNEKITHQPTKDPYIVELNYKPQTLVALDYQYCIKNPIRNINYPIIEPELLYFPINRVLATPEDNKEKTALIEIDLELLPKEYTITTSFNYNQKHYEIYESITNFRQSFIAAGNLALQTISIKGNPIHIASYGNWDFFKKDPAFYLENMIKTQRNYWQDHDFPYYSIFLVKQSDPENTITIGSHWHNSFSALLPDVNKKGALSKISHILSHELSHAWFGKKMKLEKPQSGLDWFIEGFNDYYGLKLALTSGLMNIKEYVETYNFLLLNYYLSPLNDYSAEEVKKYSEIRADFHFFVVVQGHLLAKELTQNSRYNGKEGLDAAISKLINRFKNEKNKFITYNDIDEIFKDTLDRESWEKTKRILNSQEKFSPSLTTLHPFAKLKMEQLDAPIFHFNIRKLIDEDVIADLSTDSREFNAGLRNGQKVLGYDGNFFTAPNKKVTIYIEEQGKPKAISYIPETVKKLIPQYQFTQKNGLDALIPAHG